MYPRIIFAFLLICFMAGCGSSGQQQKPAAGSVGTGQNDPLPAGDFYKRYTGTIAGKTVVMNLHRFGSSWFGNYEYMKRSRIISLTNTSDSLQSSDSVYLDESIPDGSDNEVKNAHLTLKLNAHSLMGTWYGSDGKRTYPVSLQEDYSNGALAFQAFSLEDSARLKPALPKPAATATYSVLFPAADTGSAKFVRDAIAKMLGGNASGKTVPEVLKYAAQRYFEQYRKDAGEYNEKTDSDEVYAYSYTTSQNIAVVYNNDYWVVLENAGSDYTGGAHGNYGSSFINLDLQNAKEWTLDAIVADTTALKPLLNDAVINYFGLKPGDDKSERLLVDEVSPTGNFYLSDMGLTFVYNPYEIASYADGIIQLFIPYSKLQGLLSPAFKTRMHLGERAGVAMN